MKIFSASIKREGIGKNGKAYTIVQFEDGTGRKLDSFDHILLNVVDGQSVDGEVTEEQNGKWTNYKFKMADKQSVPLQFKPVTTEPTTVDKAVESHQKASSVPQDVWDKKDRAMAWMNCNNAAATLFSSTGQGDEHIKHLKTLFALYESQINGQQSLSENFAKVLEQVPTPVVAGPPTPPAPVNEEPPAEINLDGIPF